MANQQDNTEKCPDICKAVLAEIFRIHGWTKLATRTPVWERTNFETDIKQMGLSWKQLERITQDRRRWREVVHTWPML